MADISNYYKLYLEIIINQYSVGKVIPVIVKNDNYYIQKLTFEDLKILVPSKINNISNNDNLTNRELIILGFSDASSDWIRLADYSEITSQYDAQNQRLHLILPPQWLPTQMVGRDTWQNQIEAQSSDGFLNNYEFYTYKPDGDSYSSTLFTEQRLFSKFGTLHNSGLYTFKTDKSIENNDGYVRYETTYQYDDTKTATSFLIGDIYSGNKNIWGNSVRLGGIQIQRNFNIRPDLITYPLPQFKGQAALPSTIDLIINGQKASSANVQSGPFIINNLPFMTGSGNAIVVTTDATGRQISTSVPFYISNAILKEKLFDYSLSLGKIRKDFGSSKSNYEIFATSFDARFGLTNWLTLEGNSELSDGFNLVGLGATLKAGRLGIFSGSYSNSNFDNSKQDIKNLDADKMKGNQITFGYSYNRARFGFNLNHTQRDSEYMNLSRLTASELISVNSNNSTNANLYFSKSKIGTFGFGYIHAKYSDVENRLANMSWSPITPSMLKGATISINASNDLESKDWTASFHLSMPLSKSNSSANYTYNKMPQGNTHYINYNHQIPNHGGIGYSLTTKINDYGNNKINSQAQINYRNHFFNAIGGIAGSDNFNHWFGMSGSAVIMGKGAFLSNRIGESFALIDTNRVANVTVSYENSIIGKTNRNVYIFVPSIAPCHEGKFSINTLDLPSSYIITNVERRVAAKRGTGVIIDFPIKHAISGIVTLSFPDGKNLPVGSIITRHGYENSFVGIDGISFIEDLKPHNTIIVILPDEKECIAHFSNQSPKPTDEILTIKNVICREVKKS